MKYSTSFKVGYLIGKLLRALTNWLPYIILAWFISRFLGGLR